jgi:hypothetical protein
MASAHQKAKTKQYDATYRLRHPDKIKARNAAYRAKHPRAGAKKSRDPQWEPTHAYRVYKLTTIQYSALLQAQRASCAICHRATKLVIDHDHTTGRVRGLLCDFCNKGIGFLQDSPVLLSSAIQYLGKA